jgi:hypothetical protein
VIPVTTLLLLVCAVPAWAQLNESQPHSFLQKHFKFSRDELSAIDQGKVVTKLPATQDKREVAALGVVRLNVSGEFFLQQFTSIETFKKSEFVLQIHKFSEPPRSEDLSALHLDGEHIGALKKCKIGDCNVKIPGALIERLQKEVNWSAPDYEKRATAVTRQYLLDYVRAYLKEGNSALVEYSDRPVAVQLADEYPSMLDQSAPLIETAPEFHRYLSEFPAVQLAGTENLIYWSTERVGGFKPVLSLTHVTVYKPRNESPFRTIIASKQIYANHYFEGSLALTWLVDAGPDTRGCYLIYLNRSRMDALRGGLSWLKRYLARGRIREGLIKNIQLMRDKLEHRPAQP